MSIFCLPNMEKKKKNLQKNENKEALIWLYQLSLAYDFISITFLFSKYSLRWISPSYIQQSFANLVLVRLHSLMLPKFSFINQSINQSIYTYTGKNLLIKNHILNTMAHLVNFYTSVKIYSSVTCSMKCLYHILYTAPSLHIIDMSNMAWKQKHGHWS